MTLSPIPGQTILINGNQYTFLPDPQQPDSVEKKVGRHSTVYRLRNSQSTQFALKVFEFEWRSPSITRQVEAINRLHSLPGVKISLGEVIKPVDNPELVTSCPELRYAVLMPWIDGDTWQSHMSRRQPITRDQSYLLAKSLCGSVWVLEKYGFAHCDLSGENLLIDWNGSSEQPGSSACVELIDFESVYHKNFLPPEQLPVDHSGYTLASSQGGEWSALADRFSFALLIAEMLCWHDQTIRDAAAGNQYFNPEELQTPCIRFQAMLKCLQSSWGERIAQLFEQAWCSENLEECPTCADWESALAAADPALIARSSGIERQQQPAVTAMPAFVVSESSRAEMVTESVAAAPITKDETIQEYQSSGRRPSLNAAPASETSQPASAEAAIAKKTLWQKVLGFIKDWGILFLLFFTVELLPFLIQLDFLFIFVIAFPVITTAYIWIKWRKTVHFRWGWLLGASLVFVAYNLLWLNDYGFYDLPFFYAEGLDIVFIAGSQLLLASIFASIGQIKNSLRINNQVPPYLMYFVWLFLVHSIHPIFSVFVYDWRIVMVVLPVAFLLTIASSFHRYRHSDRSSEGLKPKTPPIVFQVASILILVLVSFFTYYRDWGGCTSRGTQALPAFVVDSWFYPKYVPEGANVRIEARSLWGDRRMVNRYELPYGYVLIVSVEEGSPAEDAGMQEGDQVYRINGRNVETEDEFIDLVSSNLNKPLQIELRRDGEWLTVKATPKIIDTDNRAKIGVQISDEDNDYLWGSFMWSKDLVCP